MMNTMTKVLAAGLIATAAISGSAMADEGKTGFMQLVRTVSYDTGHEGRPGYGYQSGFLTRMANETGVHFRSVDRLPRAEAAQFKSQSSDRVAAFQETLGADTTVVDALTARSLKVSNVIGLQHAADGSTTYIIR